MSTRLPPFPPQLTAAIEHVLSDGVAKVLQVTVANDGALALRVDRTEFPLPSAAAYERAHLVG